MRSFPAKAAAVLGLSAALLLAACGDEGDTASPSASPSASASTPSSAPSATPSATPTPKPKPVKPSSNFDKVSVSGAYGKEPKVKVDTPWAIDKTRTEVLDASDGAVVKENQTIEVHYYGVNGRSGEMFDESFSVASRSPSTSARSCRASARVSSDSGRAAGY